MKWAILFSLLVLALLALAFAKWAFLPSGELPRHRVTVMRLRLRLRLRPGRGHASLLELWLRWGRFAAWRQSGRARPALPGWRRFWYPAEHSVFLGRAQLRHGLRLPVEEHALLLAPPRTGKTGMLAAAILHYPGPVVSTTTKPDVFGLTSGVRERRGPVDVFNPQSIGKVPSTFRWNPVEGCEDPAVAIRRADGFANALHVQGDNAFFQSAARAYLRAMFHAAALVRNGDMRLVSHWALTGTKGGAVDAEHILQQAGRGRWASELSQLRGPAERTAATNEMCMAQALGFMADPALAISVLPGPGAGLDVGGFLRQSGTLYLIADSDHDESPLAPLFASLASEIHYLAEMQGQATPGGRLDPPCLFALDEIVQTCPVPLPKWAADSGGKGIQIITVAHGEAQLAGRWDDNGKQVIVDTAGAVILLPGIKDAGTLKMASDLCGTVAYRVRGQDHDTHHEVMTPAMLRQLPKGRALIIRGGLTPVVAKLPRAWRERAYRRARRHGQHLAVLTPPPPPDDDPGSVLAVPEWAPDGPGGAPVARLRPTANGWDHEAEGGAEVAEVLPLDNPPADDLPRPWRSQ